MTTQSGYHGLTTMSFEDACMYVRVHVIGMYKSIGAPQDAMAWMWKDLVAYQNGEGA